MTIKIGIVKNVPLFHNSPEKLTSKAGFTMHRNAKNGPPVDHDNFTINKN
jgi:hypothetical protein